VPSRRDQECLDIAVLPQTAGKMPRNRLRCQELVLDIDVALCVLDGVVK
jgi:hypothetical protein